VAFSVAGGVVGTETLLLGLLLLELLAGAGTAAERGESVQMVICGRILMGRTESW
jgi:hypothetical protein